VELLPLFPLNHVLLPAMPLPLHVFEQRYRQLVRDLTDRAGNVRGFGVVLLRSGAESGQADVEVESVGTVAEVLELETHADGTSDLLAVGSRRFTVDRVERGSAPYLQAEVTYLDEDDGDLSRELVAAARGLMDRYDTALEALSGRRTGSELPDDAAQLSYHLAARLPLGPDERQQLLTDDTAADRLRHVARLLRRETSLLRLTRSIAVSPSVLRLAAAAN
jgi:Lon protease-like protein